MSQPDYEPRLYDADGDVSKKWYIDYRIWDTDKNAFVRKRYEGMNKYRTLAERRRVAKKKLAEVRQLLKDGYTSGTAPALGIGLDMQTATLLEAARFVQKTKTAATGRSAEDYRRLANRIEEVPSFASMPVRLVKPLQVLAFLQHLATRPRWGAKSHNSARDTLSSVFKYFVDLELLPKNPVRGVERRKVSDSDKHQPYTEAQRQAITAEMLQRGETQLALFVAFIYYGFIRSGGELRHLRIRDIKAETIRVPGGTAKNSKAEHVAIPRQLEALIQQHGLRGYAPDLYVFTRQQKPGPMPVGKHYFARRHGEILDALGLDKNTYSVYGYKHTGAINLYLASRDIELVRRHCRHHHAGITATYLRKMGALHDGGALDVMPDF